MSLPGGFRIKVQQVNQRALRRIVGVTETDFVLEGAWDHYRTIFLLERLSLRKKWHALIHEVGHIYIDWRDWVMEGRQW